MSYEQDMYIDENALDIEFLEQPALMVKYSIKLAEQRKERDLIKEGLDLARAEIDSAIRKDPQSYGLEKATETAINNAILMEEEYQNWQQKYNDANFELNVLFGVVSAIEARKSALENLVKLHGQQYFAGPSVPHNLAELREVRQKRRDEQSHKIGASLRRTK